MFGNGTFVQVEPFQSCAVPTSDPTMPRPRTAMHQVDVTHETLPVSLYVVGAVIEFGMVSSSSMRFDLCPAPVRAMRGERTSTASLEDRHGQREQRNRKTSR